MRIKFNPFEYAENFLAKAEIPFTINQEKLKQQRFLFQLSPKLLDDKGDLDFVAFSELYYGLPKSFFKQNQADFSQIIHKILDELQPNLDVLYTETQEFLYFIEVCNLVYKDFAVAMINAVEKYFDEHNVYFVEISEAKSRILSN